MLELQQVIFSLLMYDACLPECCVKFFVKMFLR